MICDYFWAYEFCGPAFLSHKITTNLNHVGLADMYDCYIYITSPD